jgi:hypothetical protein
MYLEAFHQLNKQLGQIDSWLTKATEYAAAKKFDPNLFLSFRLAPDQFAFVRQVQSACDTLKLAAARLAGKEAPSHADTETTIDELRARVKTVRAYIAGFTAADFADAATRTITQPRWEGKTMSGANYFLEHGQPNFYFHLMTAYTILRHNGVDVGKRDYLGAITYNA